MSYPKYKYHKEFPLGKIFNNAIEEVEAGDEWKESPADLFNPIVVPAVEEVKKPTKKGKK
jgi:hypothetical protein